jgi:4-hydroxy-4-methyl-2-oxoglutarate aldolase
MASLDEHLDGLAAGAEMTAALVSDALDRLGLRSQAMDGGILPVWPFMRVAGRAVPMRVSPSNEISPDAPYASEMRAVARLASGDVPVYAVEDGVRAAVWGELFACAALQQGAVGAVVDGCIRDSRQIGELEYPVFARGCSPLDTLGRAEVTGCDVAVRCGGVEVNPGDWVVGDRDGVVVVPAAALGDVERLVRTKLADERGARGDLLGGRTLQAVWDKWGVL